MVIYGTWDLVSVKEALKRLDAKSRRDRLEDMAHYGITIEQHLGVAIPELRKIAKNVGKDYQLAIDLWRTGISNAEILFTIVDDPEMLNEKQMEEWVKSIALWNVEDQVCMKLFENFPLASKKVYDWPKWMKSLLAELHSVS